MSTNLISSGTTAREKVNLRTPDVMAAVQAQVESHYRSEIVEKFAPTAASLSVGGITVRLAKQFGFCYGVERAIDLAYAARKVFQDRPPLHPGRDHSQSGGQRANRRDRDQEPYRRKASRRRSHDLSRTTS